MKKSVKYSMLSLLFLNCSYAADSSQLALDDFLQAATQNDTEFEAILMDRLVLQYRGDALLPGRDVMLSLKQQLYVYPDGKETGSSSGISLAKLFPETGTTATVNYNKLPSQGNTEDASLQLLLSQPIARNAFGRNFKMQDQIIGLENEISRYQIIEAYEDYLASLTTVWYNWYSAYENLKVSEASYASGEKLLENLRERQRQKIALPVDVNKMKLSLIRKKETLVTLEEIYRTLSNLVFQAIRLNSNHKPVPARPQALKLNIDFEKSYQEFVDISRTYQILRLLEDKSTLEVKKTADELLPSTNLLLGYQLDGQQWGLKEKENSFFAGISLDWPIQRSSEKAQNKIAEIKHKKTLLSNLNKYEELRTNLLNLHLQIEREQKLMDIAQEKIDLAQAILKDETENYSFGKVSLNDYIDAVNDVDENRFSFTEHSVKLNKLLVEWKRLTDRLVDKPRGEEILLR